MKGRKAHAVIVRDPMGSRKEKVNKRKKKQKRKLIKERGGLTPDNVYSVLGVRTYEDRVLPPPT